MAPSRLRPQVLFQKLSPSARVSPPSVPLPTPPAPAPVRQRSVIDRSRDFFEVVRSNLARPPASGRTAIDALAEADGLLRGKKQDRSTEQGATITADPDHVNNAADVDSSSRRYRDAAAQVEANATLQDASLARMPAGDRQRYHAVQEGLAADPVAQLALQTLLLRGELPGGKDLTAGADLLGQLDALAKTPLATGIPRDELLADVVQEVATPSSMAQRGRGTCAATAVEIHLLHSNPAEYVRLVAGLAGPSGTVAMASGERLRREVGTRSDDGLDRSHSQRLMAPAMMEVANGEWDYDNQRDLHSDQGADQGSGLTTRQVDVLLESVYGRDFAFGSNLDSAAEKEAAYELISGLADGGEPSLVGMRWTTGSHKVVITAASAEEVTFINPWGREERMPKDEFLDRLQNVNYDPEA